MDHVAVGARSMNLRTPYGSVVMWEDLPVACSPEGFEYQMIGNSVIIRHHGRRATTLRAAAAERFLADVEMQDPQMLMARLTGNYKRGNERAARSHPRNQDR